MPADQRPRITGALRHRDFALLWAGQTVSLAGNGIFSVALPLEVLRLTNSAIDLAIVASARTLPAVVFLLIGGTAVDRIPARQVMLACDAICGAMVGLAAVLIATGNPQIWELAALSVVFGVANAFFKPASTTIVVGLLPSDLLVSASSLTSLSQSAAQYLVGPLLGGVVLALVGTDWAFGLDAASFVVSAGCLLAMRSTRRAPRKRSPLLQEIREGIRYCRSQAWLWWSMIAVGIGNLACFVPLGILQPLLVRHVFHAGPVALGIMLSASGVGGAVASACAARWPPERQPVRTVWLAWAGSGLAAVAIGLAPWIWVAVVFAGLAWFGVIYGNVLWFPLMQREVPSDLLGRASSVDWMVSLALAPLGTLLGGALSQIIGVRPTLIIGGAVAAACGAVILIPGVTEPDRRRMAASLVQASP